jgi:hypothetical protein
MCCYAAVSTVDSYKVLVYLYAVTVSVFNKKKLILIRKSFL